jgi:hypothetical protein
MEMPEPPRCFKCGRTPEQIEEYVVAGEENHMTPTQYVLMEEGTLNPINLHFACTECYLEEGAPTAPPPGWRAP